MKQLLVLSGKGGTGKTTLVSSFIKLGNFKAYADCDVDAPNLGLLLDGEPGLREDYFGMDKAYIDPDKCIACGSCLENCKFQAIEKQGQAYQVNKLACEGCGICQRICPSGAARLEDNLAGEIQVHRGEKIFSRARLKMGEGNSGLLVTAVKDKLDGGLDQLAIIDGSPGIGCPVIASMNSVDLVLLVVEPSLSSISDMERLLKTARGFDLDIGLVINKYNVDLDNTRLIEKICKEENITLLGKIPFDEEIVRALNKGETIIGTGLNTESIIREVFERTMEKLKI